MAGPKMESWGLCVSHGITFFFFSPDREESMWLPVMSAWRLENEIIHKVYMSERRGRGRELFVMDKLGLVIYFNKGLLL